MSRDLPQLSFDGRRLLIGVVHLAALPGAPRFSGELSEVIDAAEFDARALLEGGCDALIVENFGDQPFFAGAVPPETIAAMSLCVGAVMRATPSIAVGVNVLRNDARAALGLCAATGACFLRVNVHSGAAVTDQGLLEGRAAETMRERSRLCPNALVLADVHVKHATPIGDTPIGEAARETVGRGGADAVIVTGGGTGRAPLVADLVAVREALPRGRVLLGSGLTEELAPLLREHIDGAIVGTWFKRGGELAAAVDSSRVRRLRKALDAGS